MSTEPARAQNSIDQIAFAVVFNQTFEPEDLSVFETISLSSVSERDFVAEQLYTLRFDVKASSKPTEVIGGYEFRSKGTLETPDKSVWTVSISPNSVSVVCTEYTEWDDVWAEAERYFKQVLSYVDFEKFKPIELVLQCADLFKSNSEPGYSLQEVFNLGSKYLSEQVKVAGAVWHLYQGWFTDSCAEDIKALHNLNISAGYRGDVEHATVVDHSVKVRNISSGLLNLDFESLFKGDQLSLKNFFSFSYEANKEIVKNLLSSDMLKKIGMDING